MIREVVYFEKAGPQYTDHCLQIVKKLVQAGHRYVVVASTTGDTGLKAAEMLKGLNAHLVVVTHSAGFQKPHTNELDSEKAKSIRAAGAQIYTGTILTHSLETGLAQRHSGIYPTILIAETLRRFGHGVKVGCEIVMEACDSGLIPEGEEVIAVGGTGRGADSVILARSATSKRFLDLKVLEILAKPRE
jgi:hypothetical protein